MATHDSQVLVRLSTDLKEKLDKNAKDIGMGTSTLIRTLIIKELNKK